MAGLVEQQRVQRDQRYAMAMNIVAQARLHGGRDVAVASAADASTVNMIFALLQSVAKEDSDLPDDIFHNLSNTTTNSILELVLNLCVSGNASASTPSDQTG